MGINTFPVEKGNVILFETLFQNIRLLQLVRELTTYDDGSQGPYEHLWYHDGHKWDEYLYFNAPTNGIDTLQTFKV